VRNEEHCETKLLAQMGQQIEDLCLHRHIESCGRLVGYQ
jgi:hypothetical protein